MPNPNACYQINVSTKTILKIVFIILLILFLFAIKEVIAVVFVAWVLASALDPLVDKLQRKKIPRFLSILGVYVIIFLIIFLVFKLFIPVFQNEITSLTNNFPEYYKSLNGTLDNFRQNNSNMVFFGEMEESLKNFNSTLSDITSGIYNVATGFFGAMLTIFAVLMIVYYLTSQEEGVKAFIKSIAPPSYQPYIIKKLNKIQEKLGNWLWGQILVMFAVGILTGVTLKIINVPYVLLLAVFAGLCQFIPIFGPIISAVPAVLFSFINFSDSPAKPLLVFIAFLVIQQIENQILTPKVMSKAVGLNPIIVIVTILIGAKIGGIGGIILAVPAATIISIFLEDFFIIKKEEDNKLEGEEYIKEQIKN